MILTKSFRAAKVSLLPFGWSKDGEQAFMAAH
jgi:hypothetical protein